MWRKYHQNPLATNGHNHRLHLFRSHMIMIVGHVSGPRSADKGESNEITLNDLTTAPHSIKPDRRLFIGGSDARIIMSPDEAALIRLWREKRGEAEPMDLSR